MFIYWLKAWELQVCISCSRLSTVIFSSTAARHHGYALDLPSLCSKEGAESLWLKFVGFKVCGRDTVAGASERPSGSVSKGGDTGRWACFSMFSKNIIADKLIYSTNSKTLPRGFCGYQAVRSFGKRLWENMRKFKTVLWVTMSFIWRIWNSSKDFPGHTHALKHVWCPVQVKSWSAHLPFPGVCGEVSWVAM